LATVIDWNQTAVQTAVIAAAAALGGVLVSVFAEALREGFRVRHEARVRAHERQVAAADRRRAFELENLLAAYDSLYSLVGDTFKIKLAVQGPAPFGDEPADMRSPGSPPERPQHRFSEVRTIRLILDDECRRSAHKAYELLNDYTMLDIDANARGLPPASRLERSTAMLEAVAASEDAAKAIADRIRALYGEP
jgi:hypothetical protein